MPVGIPSMINKKYQLTVTCIKCELIAPCEEPKKVNPFISARVFGNVLVTGAKPTGSGNFN